MSPAHRTWIAFLLMAIAAAAIRLPDLGRRPMHTDEAINAYTTGQMLVGEPFRYDPQDRHGPALYALTATMARLAGKGTFVQLTEVDLRRSAVLLSALVVLALGLLVRPLGLAAPALAAAFWTLAPASLYYGRYVIHETGFVAATVVFLAGLFRAPEGRRWPLVCGLGAGFMLAFKETAVLTWCIAGLALLLTDRAGSLQRLCNRRAVRTTVATCALVVILSYSWGGANWSGVLNLGDAVGRFLARASGEGHEKPWHYYLHLLFTSRSGILLAAASLAGAVRAWRSGGLWRWWPVYTVISLALLSTIPYKTPWLALNILLPLFVLAGHALAVRPALAVAGGLALLVTFAFDGRRPVWRDPAGERNPFAYAHTSEDLLRLPDVVAAWTKAHGDPLIAVVADDPWPLPWYLRNSPHVGYWRPGQDPGKADLYLTDLAPGHAVAPYIEGWIPEFFGQRPSALLILWTPKK